jgi:hypothetical protein
MLCAAVRQPTDGSRGYAALACAPDRGRYIARTAIIMFAPLLLFGSYNHYDAVTPRTSRAGTPSPSATFCTNDSFHQSPGLQGTPWRTRTTMATYPSVPSGVASHVRGKRSVYSDQRPQTSGTSRGSYTPDYKVQLARRPGQAFSPRMELQ